MVHNFKIRVHHFGDKGANLYFSMRNLKHLFTDYPYEGVRCTFLKNFMYVHINNRNNYTGLINVLINCKRGGVLSANDKAIEWLNNKGVAKKRRYDRMVL